jgi:hypothetical protein
MHPQASAVRVNGACLVFWLQMVDTGPLHPEAECVFENFLEIVSPWSYLAYGEEKVDVYACRKLVIGTAV